MNAPVGSDRNNDVPSLRLKALSGLIIQNIDARTDKGANEFELCLLVKHKLASWEDKI